MRATDKPLMDKMKSGWLPPAFLWLAACVLQPVLGEIHISPGATTQQQFRDVELAFYQRTMIDAYERVGGHDPRWDKQAKLFLEKSAQAHCGSPQAASREDRLRVGKAAIQAGCNDPLITYEYSCLQVAWARKIEDPVALKKAMSLAYDSVTALQTSGYHATQKFAACVWLWRQYPKSQRKHSSLRLFLLHIYDTASQMVMGGEYRDGEQRLLIKHLDALNDRKLFPVTDTQRLYETVRNTDPWVSNMIGGRYHMEAAWAARGGGWASKVTEEGWQGFKEHLKQAGRCFTEAARLNPERPEAARDMIQVAMGASDNPAEEMRQWFELATKAQWDYEPAYRALLWGLYPRWHGSHDTMYSFGLECAQVPRYDTLVPYFLVIVLGEIYGDSGKSFEYWKRVGAYEHLDRILKAYANALDTPHRREWYLTRLAFYALKTDHFTKAVEVLNELQDDNIDAKALEWFNITPVEMISQVRSGRISSD